jgi:hypothetical protein
VIRMLCTAAIVALALAVAVTAMASDEPAFPRGAPPRFAVVTKIRGNWILLREVHQRFIAREERHGDEARTVYRLEQETHLREYHLGRVDVFNAEGKKVPAQDAGKRLTVGSMVLVSADDRPVAAAYLNLFKADTLVIVPSREDAGKRKPAPVKQRAPVRERENERERQQEHDRRQNRP